MNLLLTDRFIQIKMGIIMLVSGYAILRYGREKAH